MTDMPRIYFNEYNILMNNTVFFPYVSGLLQAYAQKNLSTKANYEFAPFIFIRDRPDKIMKQYRDPAVAAFSASIWNMNLNLAVAQRVKQKFPECLIIFGGHNVPEGDISFLKQHPFIDIAIRGEGERLFSDILERYAESGDFSDIPGISYRNDDVCVYNQAEYALARDLDVFPSPYVEGTFDYLFDNRLKLQPIIETNRGCPYRCNFCSWSGSNKQLRFFSLDRIRQVIDWCGSHKMDFLLCADANFGIVKRDLEIAQYVVETKEKYGYPGIFRMCYGKNTEETMFQIGKLLHKHNLTKAISMARQSNNPKVLKIARRSNIKWSFFDNLQKRYNEEGIPTSTDLLLGLPGETYESFVAGIESVLQASFKSQILIYPLQVYPNTELANPEYQKKFGIQTVRLPLNEVHGSIRHKNGVEEDEVMVIATNTLPLQDWKRAMMILFITQLLHSLKLAFFVSVYLFNRFHLNYTRLYEYLSTASFDGHILQEEIDSYWHLLNQIVEGKPRGKFMREFGSTYWEVEEASYLCIATKKDTFFDELLTVVKGFLEEEEKGYREEELEEVIEYQRARVPELYMSKEVYYFKYNIPEYFDKCFTKKQCKLIKSPQVMFIDNACEYNGNKKEFAKKVVLYSRKSERMLNTTRWKAI